MNQIVLTDGQIDLIEQALVNQITLNRKEAVQALQRNELSLVSIRIDQIKQLEKKEVYSVAGHRK